MTAPGPPPGQHPLIVATRHLHRRVDDRIGTTVSVDLGPLPGKTESLDSVGIAIPFAETEAISGSTEYSGLDMQWESGEIGCLAQSVAGDADPLQILGRAYELLDEVGLALLEERDDEPGIYWRGITRHQSQWIVTEAGVPGALIIFYVAVQAQRGITTG